MEEQEFVEKHIKNCRVKSGRGRSTKRQCARNLYHYIVKWNYPFTIQSHKDLPKH